MQLQTNDRSLSWSIVIPPKFLAFHRTFREDVLDGYLFNTLQEVRNITEEWIEEFNAIRPHDALDDLPPYEYAATNP